MYRNLSYRITKDGKGGLIDLFTWDEDGNRVHKVIPHETFVTYEVAFETGLKSIFGTNLKKKTFNTKREKYKWLRENKNKKIFEASDPETELLNELYNDTYFLEDFAKYELRTHYLDIEIAVEDDFPEPIDADYPINLITVYDTDDKKYHTWALTESECYVPDRYKDLWILHKFTDEVKMLKSYIKWHKSNYPDVYTHWNGNDFDIPYICTRILKLLGKSYLNSMSPVGRVTSRKDKENNKITYNIECISNLDMLILYRDKYQKKVSGKFSLGNVGEFVLGLPKLEIKGTYKEQWRNDFQHYYEYNVRDVEILVKLEDKLRLLQLSRKICNMGLSPYEKIYSSIPYIMNSIGLYSWRHTKRVFPKYRNHGMNIINGYEGAYVYPTRPGFYINGVAVIDLNSLYPNTMISGNMSPETKVGTFYKVSDDEIIVTLANGNSKTINSKQFNSIIQNKCIVTDNNTLFYKHEIKEGIIPKYCSELYSDRKGYQLKSDKAHSELERLNKKLKTLQINPTSESEIIKLKKKIETLQWHKDQYDLFSYNFKIFLNTIYGMYGTEFSPIYDVDIAQSITLNGQFVIKSIPEFVNKYLREKYNKIENEEPIFGDTDSIGINYEIPVKSYCDTHNKNINKLGREDIKEICSELDDFVYNKLNPHCATLVNNRFKTNRGDCIKFAREKFCMEGMFFSKKHYILHACDIDGHEADTFIYKGIEIAKNELSKEVKDMLKPIYERICIEKWDERTFNNQLQDIWNVYSKYDIEKIRKNTGWGTNRVSIGFLKCEPRTSASVRAAIYYNQLIEKLQLTDKYTKIKCGDDIQWCYINPANPYGIDVIAYNEMYPDEFKTMFQIDYKTMYSKNIVKSLEPLCNIMNWTPFDPNNQVAEDIFDL